LGNGRFRHSRGSSYNNLNHPGHLYRYLNGAYFRDQASYFYRHFLIDHPGDLNGLDFAGTGGQQAKYKQQ
jgi:hypothetical protein